MQPFILDHADRSGCDDGPDGSPFWQRETRRLNGDGNVLVYPNGFELDRVAKDDPVVLLWLVSKRLIPVGLGAALAAIKRAGKTEESKAAARRRKWYRICDECLEHGHLCPNHPENAQ
jgi:hypothetical protein